MPAKQFEQFEVKIFHVPVKPLLVPAELDRNVTLRNPVDELYTLDELRDPECGHRMILRSDDPHAAVSHL